jgi:GST-like protein
LQGRKSANSTLAPAAQRALAIKDRHAFKTENDEEARRAMFPQNERLKLPLA